MPNEAIRYYFGELEDHSSRMERIAEDTNDIITDIGRLRSNMLSQWDGEAQNAYSERTQKILERLRLLYEQVSSSKKKLDMAIRTQRAAEDARNRMVGDLDDSDIFRINDIF